jgi:hypothetical protein
MVSARRGVPMRARNFVVVRSGYTLASQESQWVIVVWGRDLKARCCNSAG